jgi:DTW domain-containing protein YfiP
VARETCTRCRRPESVCLCSAIVSVANRTPVTIVQHMRERHHPFNTARIAELALDQCDLVIAWDGEVADPEFARGTALLYPGPDAIDLGSLAPAERPKRLVVLDGTWPHAKGMYKRHAWLRALPTVSLSPTKPSAYAIRREPAEHCLSSVESIAAALALIEPDNVSIPNVLTGFHALVSSQVNRDRSGDASPRRVKRNRLAQAEQLRQRAAHVVVVYAETTPPKGHARADDRDVLQLTAVRIATGETFDALGQVRVMPDERQMARIGLSEEAVRDALDAASMAATWAEFVRPTDLFVAWSFSTVEAALARMGAPQRVMRLKSVYGNVRRDARGRADEMVAREGLRIPVLAVRGRAADRLANAVALARWLAEQASGPPVI